MLAILVTSNANADLILNPTDDTWTDLNDANANKNGSKLLVGYSNFGGFSKTMNTYLRFDLTQVNKDLGPTTVVRLYVTAGADFTTGTLNLCSAGNDWNGATDGNGGQSTLTANNAPTPLCTSVLDTKTAGGAGTWVEFSGSTLSSFVNSRRIANGGDNLASFRIEWAGCSTCDPFADVITFEDRENTGGSGNAPQLYPRGPNAITLRSLRAVDSSLNWRLFAGLGLLALVCLAGAGIYRQRRTTC